MNPTLRAVLETLGLAAVAAGVVLAVVFIPNAVIVFLVTVLIGAVIAGAVAITLDRRAELIARKRMDEFDAERRR